MKFQTKFVFSLPVVFLSGALVGCTHIPAQAQTTVIEAETKLTAGDMKIVDAGDASGGKSVSIARDWQPLLFAGLSAAGEAFTLWVRHKDGVAPLQ